MGKYHQVLPMVSNWNAGIGRCPQDLRRRLLVQPQPLGALPRQEEQHQQQFPMMMMMLSMPIKV
jgi:hypothetical protein